MGLLWFDFFLILTLVVRHQPLQCYSLAPLPKVKHLYTSLAFRGNLD